MRTLSSLLSSGVSMVDALGITKSVLRNTLYVKVIARAEKQVQKGINLSEIIRKEEKLYPVLVGEMIAVGEETGKLTDMLVRGAVIYEEEVSNLTKNLSSFIEPVIMIVVGIAVGFFAVSMIRPMYSLVDVQVPY